MDKPRVVIVEDEFVIAEDIRTKLSDEGYEVAGVFSQGEPARTSMLSASPDILLVDIKLAGKMDGIQLVQDLQSTLNLPVIYITANSDPATFERAKKTRPNAFLIKPFTHVNLLAALDLALNNFSSGVALNKIEHPERIHTTADMLIGRSLFIKSDNRYKKILLDDILFAEAAGSYVHIQTAERRYTLSQNLTHFHKKTPLPDLFRIHRSYIINLNKVESFDESNVFIQNHKLPLSESHREEFMSRVHLL